jgi:hypothetical protein
MRKVYVNFFQVNYFGVIGFPIPQETTRYLLQQILTLDVATKFNWEGRGVKRGFKELDWLCRFIQGM